MVGKPIQELSGFDCREHKRHKRFSGNVCAFYEAERCGSKSSLFDLTAPLDLHFAWLEIFVGLHFGLTKFRGPDPDLDQEVFSPTAVDPNNSLGRYLELHQVILGANAASLGFIFARCLTCMNYKIDHA